MKRVNAMLHIVMMLETQGYLPRYTEGLKEHGVLSYICSSYLPD